MAPWPTLEQRPTVLLVEPVDALVINAPAHARARAAVKALNELGYAVSFTRVGIKPEQTGRMKPKLTVVDTDKSDGK